MTSRRIAESASRPGALGTALVALLAVAASLLSFATQATASDAPIPVIDLSVDLAAPSPEGSPLLTAPRGQATALRLRQGHVVGIAVPLHDPRPGVAADPSVELLYRIVQRELSRSNQLRLPSCSGRSDGIRTWFSLDSVSDPADEPTKIGLWILRGVRFFRIVDAHSNELATSWNEPVPVIGLSRRGASVVRHIYAAGGVVDVGSGSSLMRDDVFAIAHEYEAPVVALSANARALADDARNLTDSELRSIGRSGGVVALSLDESRLVRGRTATLHDVVRQVEHLVRVAGVDHVAIASGYESIAPPEGLTTAADFPSIARALLGSGMAQDDVERIFNRNALRVLCPDVSARGKHENE
ncbi:MAG TPA: membrane dipeptidase [Polyangiaceae bacterium]|nr:membrane dipeptidase [Polyangiaceae bacterium]